MNDFAVATHSQQVPLGPGARWTVSSPDLHLIVAGTRIDPVMRNESFVFRLPLRCGEVRLMSHTARPSDIVASTDDRLLGFNLRSLTLICEGQCIIIPLTDQGLSEGFYEIEPPGARWTDGAALLDNSLFRSLPGPAELHVEGTALPCYHVAHADYSALFRRFQSLGDNCEFGLVQREFSAEPLALFRWAGTDAARLVLGLCRRFEGLGDPTSTQLKYVDGDYILNDPRYLNLHTWTAERATDPTTEAGMLTAGCARLRIMRRKLLADIETGRHIFVFKASGLDAGEQSFHAVHTAMRGIGSAPLLCVTRAASPDLVGQVDALGDGLYLGHIDQFSRETISFATWRRICETTAELVDAT